MRKALIPAVVLLAAFVPASPGGAIPGPDPASEHPTFSIFTYRAKGERNRVWYGGAGFTRGNPGWDFGDRFRYSCAWAEYFDAGQLLFTVTIQAVEGSRTIVNDKYGLEDESSETNPACPTATMTAAFDGSDHFPHHTALTFSRAGQAFARLDLMRRNCSRSYWTPGDEAGEAWLWWDRDGPTFDGHHHLDCYGGHGEPRPVARAFVTVFAADVVVCTEDSLDGARCSSPVTSAQEAFPLRRPLP